MDITDRFCKYFADIGSSLASAIPTVNSATLCSFLGSGDYTLIILKPTDTRKLEEICSLFSPRKAPGHDNISMFLIKHFKRISCPNLHVKLLA